MGHCIRAFIGRNDIVKALASSWLREPILLPQNFSMLFLTDELFDDMTELADLKNNLDCSALDFFTTAVARVMAQHSLHAALAYIETEYFGGTGSQAGVLFINGEAEIKPTKSDNIINQILQRLGVYKEKGKDEFDSISLGYYRIM